MAMITKAWPTPLICLSSPWKCARANKAYGQDAFQNLIRQNRGRGPYPKFIRQ